jgi:hypothetical protein
MKNGLIGLLALWIAACQANQPVATPVHAVTTSSSTSTAEASLPSFTADLSRPFAGNLLSGEPLILQTWTPQPYAGPDISLPLDLTQVTNVHVLDGLTTEQQAFLERNGFVVIHSQEAQFGNIRVQTAAQTGQPYYLTTDAAFHALHLTFDELLKALERQQFRPEMIAITKAALETVRSSLPEVQGTSLEAESRGAEAYLSVALKLFDPSTDIDPAVADIVTRQVDQIVAAGGKAPSALFPDFKDDYGAYKPVGHYAGDPELEAYFRGMTWFGRMHFLLQDPQNPGFVPSRVPLIVTLALRRAQVDGAPASDAWTYMYETLNFVIGPSDDAGPLEYAALMDTVYGKNPAFRDLADDNRWQDFLSHSDQLPAPQINSLFAASTRDLAPEKGWRFMGQRFTLDGLIFQNMIFDRVQKRPDGAQRDFPSGLDVMAAFGSAPAVQTLNDLGATGFPNYSEQMTKMQQAVQAQPEAQWLGRFYDAWLYSFFPLLTSKDASFPAYMQTSAWGYKDLNTALGSWAELKHDTVLYTKMPEGAGGGGPPTSAPAPSYVEPDPAAFYRMAYMAALLGHGLEQCLLQHPPAGNVAPPDLSVDDYVRGLQNLAARFEELGDMAAKELAGLPLTEDENATLTSCLGMIECINERTDYNRPDSEMPKPPVIAAVSGAGESVLEVGIGGVDRLYVVVPLEGGQEVAQGGVFSYYEFTQPRAQRLTDDEWRQKLAGGDAPALPPWAANFVLTGGVSTDWLAFRKGDIYAISDAGDKLNVRDAPSLRGSILGQLKTGELVQIVDGPILADGYTWWKLEPAWSYGQELSGWAVEQQDWYWRSY